MNSKASNLNWSQINKILAHRVKKSDMKLELPTKHLHSIATVHKREDSLLFQVTQRNYIFIAHSVSSKSVPRSQGPLRGARPCLIVALWAQEPHANLPFVYFISSQALCNHECNCPDLSFLSHIVLCISRISAAWSDYQFASGRHCNAASTFVTSVMLVNI